MNSSVPVDSASTFTLNYLSLLESRLKIVWTDAGEPEFRPELVDDVDCLKLQSDLRDLVSGELAEQALQTTQAIKNSHIQCVGFGVAKQLDSMVKLGFLYGERLVLWDVLQNLLNHKAFTIDQKLCIGETACNLLLLRPIVERGSVVVLPHPVVWCDLARFVANEIRAKGGFSIPDFGLSIALATVDDGFSLHPFTVVADKKPSGLEGLSSLQGDFYSHENYIFQRAISDLLADESFNFLNGVSAVEFHTITSQYPQLNYELRKHLSLLNAGLTNEQSEQVLKDSRKELHELIVKRNEAFRVHALDVASGSVVALASTLTVLGEISLTVGGISAIAGLTPTLCDTARKWLSPPDGPILVQAFSEIRQAESTRTIESNEPIAHLVRIEPLDPEVRLHKDAFMSKVWVEERHQYLLQLPSEMAGKVLRSLTREELNANVNQRHFQNDYIGDYLADVYEIDVNSFWSHIQVSLQHKDGLLIYDGDRHIEIMCSEAMPDKVWNQLLKTIERFFVRADSLAWSAYERQIMSEVVNAQLTKFADSNRVASFERWFKGLHTDAATWVVEGIQEVNAGRIPRWLPKR